jgi:hypothetical protein
MRLSAIHNIACALVLGAALSGDAQTATHSGPMQVVHGRPYVMVLVNGRGPFRFIIDTGTGGQAIITSELAAQLALPLAGEARLNDPTGQGGQSAPLRLIDSLQVAGVEFKAIRAVEHRLPNADGDCQGMLGFTLFHNFLLTLDYPTGRILLAPGGLEPDGGNSVHPFRMPEGVPIAALIIGNIEVEAQFDSGGAGLSLPERLASQLHFSERPTIVGKGQSLSTRFPIKAAKLATDIRLGDVTLDRPWVEINAAFPLANFGSCAMQHFAITFDQANLLMRIDGPQKRITLGVTPTPLRLDNAPSRDSGQLALVPVG